MRESHGRSTSGVPVIPVAAVCNCRRMVASGAGARLVEAGVEGNMSSKNPFIINSPSLGRPCHVRRLARSRPSMRTQALGWLLVGSLQGFWGFGA